MPPEQPYCQKSYRCQNDIAYCPSVYSVLERLQQALEGKASQRYVFYIIF